MDGSLFHDLPAGPDRPRHRGSPRRRIRSPGDQWPLDDGITVVLFAGLGGACQGLEEAGCPVHVANNHSDIALAAHAALNPHTRHVRGDIFDVDPAVATGGRRVKVLWASPDCRDHSVAKGGAPRSPRVRSLPWQVCRWAAKTGAEVIFVENVREIRGWGPLVAKRDRATGRVLKVDGTVAAPAERVPVQQQQLVRDTRRMGRSFRAWRAHLQALGYAYEDRDLNCADFGVPTARRRFFAVARRDGRPIRWPARTHAPRHQAAALGLLPWVPAASIIDWSRPMPSIFERKKPLADATMRRIAAGLKRFVIDAVEPFLIPITHTGGMRGNSGAEPLPTLTCAHRGELAVVAPHLTHFRTGATGSDAREPAPTVTANGGIGTKRPGCGIPVGVVGAFLAEHRGNSIGQAAEQPAGTQTQVPHHAVVGATMVQMGYGEREGQNPRALDPAEPLGTVVAGGGKHGIASAWMVQHNTGVVGHQLQDALSTMTTAGSQQQVAAAWLTKFRGTCAHGQDAADPAPSFTAGGFHAAAVAAFLQKYYGTGGQEQGVDEPLHTLSTKARFGIVTVTIAGQPYVIADIGMRMLDPDEAAAAHELRLPADIVHNGKRRPLTKTEAMALVGNSVPKRMARLLAEANAVHALTGASVAAE